MVNSKRISDERRKRLLSSFATKALDGSAIDTKSTDKTQPGKREFIDHLNESVFEPELGGKLKTEKVKQIIDGLSEQILILAMNDIDVKFGMLGTFRSRKVPPGTRRNPVTNEYIQHEMLRIDFEPARRVKELLRAKRDD